MGCKQSKAAASVDVQAGDVSKPPSTIASSKRVNIRKSQSIDKSHASSSAASRRGSATLDTAESNDAISPKADTVFNLLLDASSAPCVDELVQGKIMNALTPVGAAYQCPRDHSTPLHVAVKLLDSHLPSQVQNSGFINMLDELIRAHPASVQTEDCEGNLPLHYAVAPSLPHSLPASSWKTRTAIVRLLLAADRSGKSIEYLKRNNVVFALRGRNNIDINNDNGGCSPLYRTVQTIPDDFSSQSATLEFLHFLLTAVVGSNKRGTDTVCRGNASDGDKPLALLYRRFTRQFDLAEKFFSGDNSRPEVVEHRRNYKQAAGNTWKIIELLLQHQEQASEIVSTFRTIHRAVQGETPPDLLRYIVETNAEDLTVCDEAGNLPLHYAAKSRPPRAINGDHKTSFPAFYSKYVIDELLYKYPEAASMADANGNFPLTLAVKSGKHWIGGGIKSLHDAYPDALKQIDLDENIALKKALSMDVADGDEENDEEDPATAKEEKTGELIRDEQHDAIMLVQQENVDVSEVVASMWAHEEDAGVQMLGCLAISRLTTTALRRSQEDNNMDDIMRIALSAVPAVVNAMKAHPNEVIVQEKACNALKGMAWSDGKREISFVASGAVAAIIGAMQAHVSDPGVQEEACAAVSRIIHYGGSDRATVVASVSGLTAIVNAIAAHPDVLGVQRHGCRALRELTEFPDANLPELPRSQTESLLQAAKQNYPDECEDSVNILLERLS